MTANPDAPATPGHVLNLSQDQVRAEDAAVRNGLFGMADDPNPGLGTPDRIPDAPHVEDEGDDAPRTLSIREQIAERAKAARRAADEGIAPEDLEANESGEYIPPFLKAQEDAAAADEAQRKEEEAAKASENKYTLKVNGNDVPVKDRAELVKLAEIEEDEAGDFTDAQLIKLAQKQQAANAILDEAKAARKSARQAARDDTDDTLSDIEAANTDHDDSDEDTTQHQRPSTYRETIEKIQFGDPEEAERAFADALHRGVNEALTANRLSQNIATVETMIDRATREFEASNTDLVQDEMLANALYNGALVGEFKKDLLAAGLPEEKVNFVLGNNLDTALKAYVTVAADGRVKLRTPEKMLSAAADVVRGKFQRPASTPSRANARTPVVDRTSAKRQLAPQPTRASVPQQATAPRNGQAPEARSAIVAKMAKQRGRA